MQGSEKQLVPPRKPKRPREYGANTEPVKPKVSPARPRLAKKQSKPDERSDRRSNAAQSPSEVVMKGEYFMSLIRPSSTLEAIAWGEANKDDRCKISYGLLTRQPLPVPERLEVASMSTTHTLSLEPYVDSHGERETILFSPKQRKLVEDYSESLLGSHANWRELFKLRPTDFWASTLALPIYYDEGCSKWCLAWGIISAASSSQIRTSLLQLVDSVRNGETNTERTKQIIHEVSDHLGFPFKHASSGNAAEFLQRFPIQLDRSEQLLKIIDFDLEAPENQDVKLCHMVQKRYLFNDLMHQWQVEDEEKSWEANSKNLFPYTVPIEWLRMGFLCSALLPSIVNYTRMIWMKKLYPTLHVLDETKLIKAFTLAPADNKRAKRLQRLGGYLVYYLLASDLLVRKECNFGKSAEAQSLIPDSTRLAVAQVVPFEVQEQLLNIDLRSARVTSTHTAPWNNLSEEANESWKHGEVRDPQAPLSEQELNIVGQVLHALLAVCYLEGGIQLARRLANDLGILKGQTILNEIEGLNVDTQTYRFRWEIDGLFAPRTLESTMVMVPKVESAFGYRFNMWERLAQASTHSDISRLAHRTSFFKTLDILGSSAFILLVFRHLLLAFPSEEQTDMNRTFSMSVIQEIMGRIVGDHELDLGFAYDHAVHGKAMKSAREKLVGLKPGKLTRLKPARLWIRIFQALVGGILYDSCFDLERLETAILPVIKPFLEDAMGFKQDTEFFLGAYKQFIPTHIIPSVYREAVSSKRLYATIIKFSDPVGGASSGTDRGFIILSGKEFPLCPDMNVSYPPAWSSSICQVATQPHPEKVLSFNDEEIRLLGEFQEKFYKDIVVPHGKIIKEVGKPEKLYSIMPAMKQTNLTDGDWEIDWKLVNNVVNESTPAAWEEIIPMCMDENASESQLIDLEKRATAESTYESPPLNWSSPNWPPIVNKNVKPRILFLLESIVWKTKHGSLVCLSDLERVNDTKVQYMCRGAFLNAFGVLNCLPERHDYDHGKFEWPWQDVVLKNCKPTQISVSCFRRAWVLPSVLRRLEMHLLADDFRRTFSIPQSLPLSALTTSLTCQSAQDLDPELLNVIGTTIVDYIIGVHLFIQHRQLNEGQLSNKLSKIVEGSIVPEEHRQNIAGHLSSGHFNPHRPKTSWCPPGASPFFVGQASEIATDVSEFAKNRLKGPIPENGRWLSRATHIISENTVNFHARTVAGVLFLHIGLEASEKFLLDLGVVKIFDLRHKQKKRVQSSRLKLVEASLGYEFNDMEILAESLVHPSVNAPKNYNRLEFIGDLVLEVLAVRYVCELHENLSQEKAFKLKMLIVTNETLGRIAMSNWLNLHRVLLYKSPKLEREFAIAEKLLQDVGHLPPGDLGIEIPKVAGDVFESIIGAVLVDSSFQLEVVSSVLKPLLTGFLEKWIRNPEWLWEREQAAESEKESDSHQP